MRGVEQRIRLLRILGEVHVAPSGTAARTLPLAVAPGVPTAEDRPLPGDHVPRQDLFATLRHRHPWTRILTESDSGRIRVQILS